MSQPSASSRPIAWRYCLLGVVAAGFMLLCLCALTAAIVGAYLYFASPRAAESLHQLAESAPVLSQNQAINRIVLVDDQGHLLTTAPDGSRQQRLGEEDFRFQFPAWSPDGAAIAAAGGHDSVNGVYVLEDQAGIGSRAIYESQEVTPFYLYWSPDSQWVSFLANDKGELDFWLTPADAHVPANLIVQGQPFYWQWAPSSREVLLHVGGSDLGARLGFLDLTEPSGVDNLAAPGFFQAPGISASERYVSFSALDEDGQARVVVQDRQGGVRSEVAHQGVAAMSWSPTADQLAFISPEHDAPHFFGPLRLFDAETGGTRVLSEVTNVAFFWSPDGRTIAAFSPLDRELNPGAGLDASPVFAAARTQTSPLILAVTLIDVASGEQRRLVTFQPSPLFVAQFLPFFDQYALSHRLWSPASDALVLPTVDLAGAGQIMVVHADDGSMTVVGAGSIGFWSQR